MESFPFLFDEQWGIVGLSNGGEVAGFVHLEDRGRAVQVDVPALPRSPANVVVFPPHDVLRAHACSVADVLKFVEQHRWPTPVDLLGDPDCGGADDRDGAD